MRQMEASEILSQLLRLIPDVRSAPLPIAALADQYSLDPATTRVMLQLLVLYDAIEFVEEDERGGAVRCRHDGCKLLLETISDYVSEKIPIVSDWERLGAASAHAPLAVPMFGPSYLRLLDEGRPHAPPARNLSVAKALIVAKASATALNCYLVKYETAISQYQLIGGRLRQSDGSLERTIEREIWEETGHCWPKGADIKATPVPPVIDYSGISPTAGARTAYQISYFHITSTKPIEMCDPGLEWVTECEILNGHTNRGVPINEPGFRNFVKSAKIPPSSLAQSYDKRLRRHTTKQGAVEVIRNALEDRPLAVWGMILGVIGIAISLITIL